MTKHEAALYVSKEPSFRTAWNGAQDDVLISAWESALANKSEPWSGGVSPAAKDEAHVQHESRYFKTGWTNEKDVIAREIMFAVKEMVSNGFSTAVQEYSDDILSTSFNNAQNGIDQLTITSLSR